MNSYVLLPLLFLKFWFFEAPIGIIACFASFNHAFLELFSLPLFLKTFFQPLKSEYRQGLVGFSRVIGMLVKSVFIFIDVLFLSIILLSETIILVSFLAFPILTVLLLFH
jgi:hypothetical protein